MGQAVMREAVVGTPRGPAALAVSAYQGYRERGVPPARHLGLPSPWLTLIFTLDEPLCLAGYLDRARPPDTYRALAGGLHTSPALVVHDGAQSGVQLLVHPLAARVLFGVPGGVLAGIDVHAADVLGAAASRIGDRLAAAASWAARFAVLDEELGRLVCAGISQRPDGALLEAWRLLTAPAGRASVARVAATVGYSERHLAHRLRAEAGFTPKLAASVARFDRARRELGRRVAGRSLADLAARHGYADQSHLDREFGRFTGRPPTRWLAEEIGNVQAGPASTGAS